jgi:hypothetical protein
LKFNKKASEKTLHKITLIVTAVCVVLVALGIILPFIL